MEDPHVCANVWSAASFFSCDLSNTDLSHSKAFSSSDIKLCNINFYFIYRKAHMGELEHYYSDFSAERCWSAAITRWLNSSYGKSDEKL